MPKKCGEKVRKDVVRLYTKHKMRVGEIASILNISKSTVVSFLKQAKVYKPNLKFRENALKRIEQGIFGKKKITIEERIDHTKPITITKGEDVFVVLKMKGETLQLLERNREKTFYNVLGLDSYVESILRDYLHSPINNSTDPRVVDDGGKINLILKDRYFMSLIRQYKNSLNDKKLLTNNIMEVLKLFLEKEIKVCRKMKENIKHIAMSKKLSELDLLVLETTLLKCGQFFSAFDVYYALNEKALPFAVDFDLDIDEIEDCLKKLSTTTFSIEYENIELELDSNNAFTTGIYALPIGSRVFYNGVVVHNNIAQEERALLLRIIKHLKEEKQNADESQQS